MYLIAETDKNGNWYWCILLWVVKMYPLDHNLHFILQMKEKCMDIFSFATRLPVNNFIAYWAFLRHSRVKLAFACYVRVPFQPPMKLVSCITCLCIVKMFYNASFGWITPWKKNLLSKYFCAFNNLRLIIQICKFCCIAHIFLYNVTKF